MTDLSLQREPSEDQRRPKHGPNIADVMLNKRIDELAELERALTHHDWYRPHRRALEERRDHLRPICLRGLARCYPHLSPDEIEHFLQTAIWINR